MELCDAVQRLRMPKLYLEVRELEGCPIVITVRLVIRLHLVGHFIISGLFVGNLFSLLLLLLAID